MAVQIIVGGASGTDPIEIIVDGKTIEIRGITDRWYDKKANYFKVAASNGHAEIVKTLVANGANVNAKGKYGWTALKFTAQAIKDHLEVISLLKRLGAKE